MHFIKKKDVMYTSEYQCTPLYVIKCGGLPTYIIDI